MIETYTIKSNLPQPFLEGVNLSGILAVNAPKAPGKADQSFSFKINTEKTNAWILAVQAAIHSGTLIYAEQSGTAFVFTFNNKEAALAFEESWGAA